MVRRKTYSKRKPVGRGKRKPRKKPFFGRKNYKKKRNANKSVVTKTYADMRRLGHSAPLVQRNWMKYQDYKQVNGASAVGQYTYHMWRMNSLYDPDAKLPGPTGTSTVMYTDMYNLYQRSKVNSCAFSQTIVNLEAHAIRTYFILQLSATPLGDPAVYDLTQMPGFLGYVQLMPGGAGDKSFRTFKRRINVVKWLKKLLYPNPITASFYVSDLWAVEQVNPAQELYLAAYTTSFTDANNHQFIYEYSMDMRYDVTWAQPSSIDFASYDNYFYDGHGPTGVSSDDTGPTGP